MPNPEKNAHAECSERVGADDSPKGKQLVGALGKDLKESIKQDLEHEKDRDQRAPYHRVPDSPVHQRNQSHTQKSKHGEVKGGVHENGPEDQVLGIGRRVPEQDYLSQ